MNPTPNAGRLAISLRPRDERRANVDDDRRAPEARGRADPRHDRVLPAGAGYPDQHAGKPRAVSIHAGRHRRRRRGRMVREARRSGCAQDRRLLDVASEAQEGGLAHAGPGRPRNRRPARRLDAVDQRHAERRLRPAPDFDDLFAGQPVSRHPRGAAELSAGSRRRCRRSTSPAPTPRPAPSPTVANTAAGHDQHQHLGDAQHRDRQQPGAALDLRAASSTSRRRWRSRTRSSFRRSPSASTCRAARR